MRGTHVELVRLQYAAELQPVGEEQLLAHDDALQA